MSEHAAPPLESEPARLADPASSRGHIPVLDGLRGLAILLVLLCHFLPHADHPASLAGKLFFFIGRCGWCGVDLFFVLSGFLITGILLTAKGDPHYFRNFYARRTLRIFPLYYLSLTLVLVIVPLIHPAAFDAPEIADIRHRQGWLWTYCSNIYMTLKNDTTCFQSLWLNLNPFWSLAVEEHFYLLWPAVVFLLSRRALVRVCMGCIIGSLLIRAAMFFAHRSDSIYVFTPCRVDALAVGALLACLIRDGAAAAKMMLRRAMPVAILLGIATLASLSFDPDRDTLLNLTLGYTLIAAFFGATLVAALGAPQGAWIGRLFSSRFLRLLGKYSYGLYVYHVLLGWAFEQWFGQRALSDLFRDRLHLGGAAYGASVFAFILLAGVSSLAVAWTSWHLFEKRFLRLKRFFEHHEPAPADHRSKAPSHRAIPNHLSMPNPPTPIKN